MAYELPKLDYAYNALEPHIDARTMEIHHTKHHQAYINNANNALKDQPALAALEVNALIADLGKGCAFKRVGVPDEFSPVGYPDDLYHHYKLDSDGVIETVRQVMGKEFEEDEDWQDEL